MSRFFNPRTPWSELERRLSDRPAQNSQPAATGDSAVNTAGKTANKPQPASPPLDPEATGSDAPALARPARYPAADYQPPPAIENPAAPVSVGPRGADGYSRYQLQPTGASAADNTPGSPHFAPSRVPYAELHVHSDFSFLDGASEPEELVAAGHEAGLSALALTDHNGLYGVVRFAHAANAVGLPTVFGSELSLGLTQRIPGQVDPQAEHLLVLAASVTGYQQLSAAITSGNLRGEKNRPVLNRDELAAYNADWFILTGCRKGPLLKHLGDDDGGLGALRTLIAQFGADRIAVELTRTGDPRDDERIRHLCELAKRTHLPIVASNNVHYARRAGFHNAQVRAAVRSHMSLTEVAGWLPPTAVARIHSGEEMRARFPAAAIATADRIGRECAFALSAAKAQLPTAPTPAGLREEEYLRQLVTAGGEHFYGSREANPQAWELLDKELATIEAMGFCGYFLIVYDIARFCHDNNIFCQGRGSAANSAVCYVLKITAVDAVRFGLLFDRFLAPEREGYPDIDIDIESGRREEVIQYVYTHYGRERAAQVANVITYRAKSAVRDAAAVLGFEPGQQDAFSKGLNRWSQLPEPADTEVPAQVLSLAAGLLNTPRHLGIHSGGMILADRPIGEVVPIEPATMPDRTVVQWDKDDCAAMDLVKFDLLGLGMLTALHEMVDLVARHTGEVIERGLIPVEDHSVYDMLCAGDAVGVFQVESRAQLATLPRLRPRTFYDLAVQVALIRPGPIQGGSVHPYIRRRQGVEEVTYLHPLLENALGKTLGVPLFQEQLMQMAIDVAGFSGAESDELRRAMGAKRSRARMTNLATRFFAGTTARGVDREVAQAIFDKIAAFANYGFPESHAISFANLVYDSAWFKRHHHAAFTAGLLRAQPMGFYSPQSLIADARRHGVEILPVDINASATHADLAACPDSTGGLGIRLGLAAVRDVSVDAAEAVVAARATAPFVSLADVAERTGLSALALEGLATAGAFDCFDIDRRQALWVAGAVAGSGPEVLAGTVVGEQAPVLPLMSSFDVTLAELWATGVTVRGYPTEELREQLRARGYASTADTAAGSDGRRMTVAGIVTHRQRPATASGITFLNIEDEFGMLNIVCTAGLMKRYRSVATSRNTVVITGILQRAGEVVSLYAHSIHPLEVQLPVNARNFR